jgi:hypothetical protein
MSVYRELFKEFRIRLIVGFCCFLVGILAAVWSGGSAFGFMVALPFIGLGAFVVAPAITSILAQPFSSLFYPSERFDGPQPMYGIPQGLRAKGFYEDAMAGYEQIAMKYPDEVKPYIEMVNIAIMDLRDVERARSIVGRGLVLLDDETARKILKESYDAVVTRLEVKPEWLRDLEDRSIAPEKIERIAPVPEPDGLTGRRYHSGGYVQDGKDGFVDDRKKIGRKEQ